MSTVCTTVYCIDVPIGWDGEVADTYIAFHHTAAPEATWLTASLVDQEAVVRAAGGSWPATTGDVVRAFWKLLEDVGEGELDRTERMIGGAVRSSGSHSTGDMWFVLWPLDATTAVGIEMRAPNDTWEAHADAVFPTIEARG